MKPEGSAPSAVSRVVRCVVVHPRVYPATATATLAAAREQHLAHLALVVGFEVVVAVAG